MLGNTLAGNPDAMMAFPEVLLLVTVLSNHGIRKSLFKTGRQKNVTLQPPNCYYQPDPEINGGKKPTTFKGE